MGRYTYDVYCIHRLTDGDWKSSVMRQRSLETCTQDYRCPCRREQGLESLAGIDHGVVQGPEFGIFGRITREVYSIQGSDRKACNTPTLRTSPHPSVPTPTPTATALPVPLFNITSFRTSCLQLKRLNKDYQAPFKICHSMAFVRWYTDALKAEKVGGSSMDCSC